MESEILIAANPDRRERDRVVKAVAVADKIRAAHGAGNYLTEITNHWDMGIVICNLLFYAPCHTNHN
jgi:hypothetical protein